MKAVREEEVKLRGKDLWNRSILSREWKREGVMDEQSGESQEEEVIGDGIGEAVCSFSGGFTRKTCCIFGIYPDIEPWPDDGRVVWWWWCCRTWTTVTVMCTSVTRATSMAAAVRAATCLSSVSSLRHSLCFCSWYSANWSLSSYWNDCCQ